MTEKLNLVYDMETSDPDDAMTLFLLAWHPKVNLRAVTVTPGSDDQIGMVKSILSHLKDGRVNIPVGSRKPGYEKSCVSDFHHKWLLWGPEAPDGEAHEIMYRAWKNYPDLTILTGGPPSNLVALMKEHPDVHLQRWVAQGGFAGDSIVPPEHRLPKFEGRETCPTFNFNGDPKGTLYLLSEPRIAQRVCVSKNVCHGVVYDWKMHRTFEKRLASDSDGFIGGKIGLEAIHTGMDLYLKKTPSGKMFHDPLAACVAIDESVCTLVPVELYREKGEWGSRKLEGSTTRISVAGDYMKFMETLLA